MNTTCDGEDICDDADLVTQSPYMSDNEEISWSKRELERILGSPRFKVTMAAPKDFALWQEFDSLVLKSAVSKTRWSRVLATLVPYRKENPEPARVLEELAAVKDVSTSRVRFGEVRGVRKSCVCPQWREKSCAYVLDVPGGVVLAHVAQKELYPNLQDHFENAILEAVFHTLRCVDDER